MESSTATNNDVKEETTQNEELAAIAPENPSFNGKLNLKSFGFSRSSSRLLSKSSPAPEPIDSSAKGSRKRKSSSSASSPKRKNSGYAPPSTYSHLPELKDTLEEGLICVFIGLNPGITTATLGHAYAHPTNHFWRFLHSSRITPRLCLPSETAALPSLFSLGNTNIVSRPSRNGSELRPAELDAGVQILETKIAKYRPEAVCIVGKSIWESIWRVKKKRKIGKEEFRYGWQDERMGVVKDGDGEPGWEGTRVFVATTTSALAAGMSLQQKEDVWNELGSWVEKRREERAESAITAPPQDGQEVN